MPNKTNKAQTSANNAREMALQPLRDKIASLQAALADVEDSSPAKMRRIRKLVASVPEGAALLKLAAETKTRITFSATMTPGLAGVTQPTGGELQFSPEGGIRLPEKSRYKIHIDPLSTTFEAAVTLAHELRHLWQNGKLESNRLVTTAPSLTLAYSRIVEGDARAFAAYFRARLEEKEAGLEPKPWTAAQWKRDFIAYQKDSISAHYDRTVLSATGKTLGVAIKIPAPDKRQKFLTAIFNKSAAEALKNVDKILVAGFEEGAKPYLPFNSEAALAAKMVGYAKPATREKLRKMEKTIRTGHP